MDNGTNRLLDELQRLFQNLNGSRNNRNNLHSTGRGNSDTAEVLLLLTNIINSYNDNIRDYQNNTRLILRILYSLIQNNSTSNRESSRLYTFRSSRSNTLNSYDLENLINYAIYPTNPIRLNNIFQGNELQRPSSQQIDNATIIFDFSLADDNIHTNCPITLDEFQEGEQVCRIRHCGHTFRNSAIQNWFQRNTHCPVCRYDIRDYLMNSQGEREREQSNTQIPRESPNLLYNTLRDNLTNIVSEYLNSNSINTDLSGNLIYTFEFPIFSDLSYNLQR